MKQTLSRRQFLEGAAVSALVSAVPPGVTAFAAAAEENAALDFPLIDFHAHLEGDVTIDKAVQVGKERGVKLGICMHGGFHQEIGDDGLLKEYVRSMSAYPIFKGMQAEGLDWFRAYSKEAVAQLDYVLSDALTFPEKDGTLVHLWTDEAKVPDKQDFMDRYVAFNVRVIAQEPIDIFANPTFLPDAIVKEYDELWTRERMEKVIAAAVENRVAIEINSRYSIPSLAFLKLAKDAGAKFSFGSNAHGKGIAQLDYSIRMAKELGLTKKDMFMPALADQKPILWRKIAA